MSIEIGAGTAGSDQKDESNVTPTIPLSDVHCDECGAPFSAVDLEGDPFGGDPVLCLKCRDGEVEGLPRYNALNKMRAMDPEYRRQLGVVMSRLLNVVNSCCDSFSPNGSVEECVKDMYAYLGYELLARRQRCCGLPPDPECLAGMEDIYKKCMDEKAKKNHDHSNL